jgi:hypothetical protein
VRDFEPLIGRVDALARGDAVVRAKLEAISDLATRIVAGCDAMSVAIVLAGEPFTAAMTDRMALEVDLLQYRFQEGPCLDAVVGEGRVVRVDLVSDPRYERLAPGALDAGIADVLSLPLRLDGDGSVIGSLNTYSRTAGGLLGAEPALAPFVGAASAVVAGAPVLDAARGLYRQVSDRMEEDALVHQAAGILAARQGCSIEAALAELATMAVEKGLGLRGAAEVVLRDQVSGDG